MGNPVFSKTGFPAKCLYMRNDRREFMTWSLAAGFGALLANFGVASYSLFSPMRSAAKAVPVPVDISLIPENGFFSVNYGSVGAYVGKSAGGEFLVLSGGCPHMGCRLKWVEESGRFACPCHEGFFDNGGNVISGPVRTPMAALPYTVENGALIVGKSPVTEPEI